VSRHPHVVVRVERSGGFAGVSRDWTADSADLTAEQAALLRALVEAAVDAVGEAVTTVGEAADALGEAAGAVADAVRDGFDYEVSAQVGGHRHRWQGSAADVPAVRQLAEHVREVAFGG
jgi:hypothetical protein